MKKNPLRYQISEYDCGPTSMLNGISYLFEREEISPVIVRNIMLYCLDEYNVDGIMGKSGTSSAAMHYLSYWLNGFGRTGQLSISSRYLEQEQVYFGSESMINDTLRRGGAVVLRVLLSVGHYVLLTGIEDGIVRVFDPYLKEEDFPEQEIVKVTDRPAEYNRLIPVERFMSDVGNYRLGPAKDREAVLLFNGKTELTAENTIEYII